MNNTVIKIAALMTIVTLMSACGGGGDPEPEQAKKLAIEAELKKALGLNREGNSEEEPNTKRRALAFTKVINSSDKEVQFLLLQQAMFGNAPDWAYWNIQSAPLRRGEPLGQKSTELARNHLSQVSDQDLVDRLLINLKISKQTVNTESYDTLRNALLLIFATFGKDSRGQIIANLVTLLPGLEGDVTYGDSAKEFNKQIQANYYYTVTEQNLADKAVPLGYLPKKGSFNAWTVTRTIDKFNDTANCRVSARVLSNAIGPSTGFTTFFGLTHIGQSNSTSMTPSYCGAADCYSAKAVIRVDTVPALEVSPFAFQRNLQDMLNGVDMLVRIIPDNRFFPTIEGAVKLQGFGDAYDVFKNCAANSKGVKE